MASRAPRVDPASRPAALKAAGAGRFELSGDLGFANAARVLALGDEALANLKRAEIDLAGVGRVDSAGLALLLEWSAAARESGRVVCYRNVPPAISALAGISEVEELLDPEGGGCG